MHGDRPQNAIEKAFSKGDIFVSLASKEGFGMAIAEAMVLSAPVVMGFKGGICEILKDGEDSIIVEQNDFEEFAKKIDNLDKDRKLLRKIKENACKNIKKTFKMKKNFFIPFVKLQICALVKKNQSLQYKRLTLWIP